MPTISQSLTVPSTIAAGGAIAASDVSTLYSTMNAFVIPDTVGVFQQATVNNTAVTLTIGGTVTQDWTVSIAANKATIFAAMFSWSTSGATLTPSLQFRANAAAYTAATNLTAATATGSGVWFSFLGAHDGTVLRPAFVILVDGAGTFSNIAANANLPNAALTSLGVTLGNATAGTLTIQYIRIWREG